ncbi:MAG: DUF1937 family protein [Alphaproteobacteria bacterium]|nr:DUF1937 family protein [Alphaproteobacteria bacterium]
MEKGLYYLAGPHKGTLEEETNRFNVSRNITIAFIKQGIPVFSPIVYSKQFVEDLNISSLEDRRKIVMDYLLSFLKASKGMILVAMEGWKTSWGVNLELKFCQEHHIPVYLMSPDQGLENLSSVFLRPLQEAEIDQLLAEYEVCK